MADSFLIAILKRRSRSFGQFIIHVFLVACEIYPCSGNLALNLPVLVDTVILPFMLLSSNKYLEAYLLAVLYLGIDKFTQYVCVHRPPADSFPCSHPVFLVQSCSMVREGFQDILSSFLPYKGLESHGKKCCGLLLPGKKMYAYFVEGQEARVFILVNQLCWRFQSFSSTFRSVGYNSNQICWKMVHDWFLFMHMYSAQSRGLIRHKIFGSQGLKCKNIWLGELSIKVYAFCQVLAKTNYVKVIMILCPNYEYPSACERGKGMIDLKENTARFKQGMIHLRSTRDLRFEYFEYSNRSWHAKQKISEKNNQREKVESETKKQPTDGELRWKLKEETVGRVELKLMMISQQSEEKVFEKETVDGRESRCDSNLRCENKRMSQHEKSTAKKNLPNCLQLTCSMLQPSCHPNSTLCTVTVHQSLVESLLEKGWSKNRSFLGASACKLQAFEQVFFSFVPKMFDFQTKLKCIFQLGETRQEKEQTPGLFPWHFHASDFFAHKGSLMFGELGHNALRNSQVEKEVLLCKACCDPVLTVVLRAVSPPCHHNVQPYVMVTRCQLQAEGFPLCHLRKRKGKILDTVALEDLKTGLGEGGSRCGLSSKEEKERIGLHMIFEINPPLTHPNQGFIFYSAFSLQAAEMNQVINNEIWIELHEQKAVTLGRNS
ncbi:hypothetical protein VP01_1202g1 [Puccinia sorghi]|uniref:Uncharacterized protein n=1 Tax=Puccinia sorghi TaxID=27349 RepID=A0A0L6VQJ0_9BASI|nr:hypothetical protein VP01_1202g1 [Puccinia sorghi]